MIIKDNKLIIPKSSSTPSGTIQVASDKSISHRAIMCGAIAEGVTKIENLLLADDVLNTVQAFRALGIDISIDENGKAVVIGGELKKSKNSLFMGNSGTSTRLLIGILSHLPFETTLFGDASLEKRPMNRVVVPLRKMGAKIIAIGEKEHLPLTISGGGLRAIEYLSPIASAQVKSAILFAGLRANGITSVTEPSLSRDHTEKMLTAFGVEIIHDGLKVSVYGGQRLRAQNITIPADISSAAYFMVLGLTAKNSKITIQNVGVNQTRTGIIDVICAMGGDIKLLNMKNNAEPAADITVASSELHGIVIEGDIIPRLIDEIPIIAVMAAFSKGKTVIRNAEELKVKESNRILTTVEMINSFGGKAVSTDDGMVIMGKNETKPRSFKIDAGGDHRIAMSSAIMAVSGGVECEIDNAGTILTSFPSFVDVLSFLLK